MNFAFPAVAEQFRAELRQFIAEELPDWWTHLFNDDERVPEFTVEFCKKLAKRNCLPMCSPNRINYNGTFN